MFGRLLFLFIFIPIIELYLLMLLGSRIGPMPTIGLIVLTGFLGASLARSQGLSTLRKIQKEMGEGRPPTQELVEGVMILIGGVVLLTPGILTDLFGFAMLLPGFRKSIASKLKASLVQSVAASKKSTGSRTGSPNEDDDVIDI
jgi:UPF0716 protein FxsA